MNASTTGLPFDDIRSLLNDLPGPDAAAVDAVRQRDAELTKPPGSLGKMEELAEWLAAWQGRTMPVVNRPVVAVFAGNHGVATGGVSAFPASATAQMVQNFSAGGAAINQLCKAYDLGLKVYELALEIPTGDIRYEDAMSEADCAATMAYGMEAIAGGVDLLCIGEMGIGNTTVAAAIFNALFGGAADDWVGAGTGVDTAGLSRKSAAVSEAIARIDGTTDGLEILRRVGGREFAAMAGAIIGARMQQVPVIIDGFVATAAAACLSTFGSHTLDHCLFSHCSAEQGHTAALAKLNKSALLDLNLRLGEGSGAALAASIVRGAALTHSGMSTFAEAGVAGKDAQ